MSAAFSRIVTTFLCLSVNVVCFAQQKLYVNPGVDTTDKNIKDVLSFYQQYMSDFKGKKLPDFKKYWSVEDCKSFKIPDPAVYGIGGDYPTYSMATAQTVFYIKPVSEHLFVLKSTGGWIDSLKNYNVLYNSNHYIRRDNGKLNFISPYSYTKDQWTTNKVGTVTFFHPKTLSFKPDQANLLIKSIRQLEKDWNVPPIAIKYFYTSTYDEVQFIRGFDYTMGLGNADKPTGISNQDDNIVYCAGNGENYFHEVVHLYLNPIHQKSPLNEGLAVFYGGSLGKPLNWHIKRLQTYLQAHQEVDLSKLNDFYFMDNYTNPYSTILGMLCQISFEKDGIKGLKRIMAYTSLTDIFEKEFGLNSGRQNHELRKLIADYPVTGSTR